MTNVDIAAMATPFRDGAPDGTAAAQHGAQLLMNLGTGMAAKNRGKKHVKSIFCRTSLEHIGTYSKDQKILTLKKEIIVDIVYNAEES